VKESRETVHEGPERGAGGWVILAGRGILLYPVPLSLLSVPTVHARTFKGVCSLSLSLSFLSFLSLNNEKACSYENMLMVPVSICGGDLQQP
jgi:hypothetical protein